jgi:hypothetical protein
MHVVAGPEQGEPAGQLGRRSDVPLDVVDVGLVRRHARADHHETRLGPDLCDLARGGDEVLRALLRIEVADLPDDERVGGDTELGAHRGAVRLRWGEAPQVDGRGRQEVRHGQGPSAQVQPPDGVAPDMTASARRRTTSMSMVRTGAGTRVSTICQTTATRSSSAASAPCGLASPGNRTMSGRSARMADRSLLTSPRRFLRIRQCRRGSRLKRILPSGMVRTSMPRSRRRATLFPGSSGRRTVVNTPRSRSEASSSATWF